ncbi:GHMP kinase [Vibrio diazotrophicus]|uniref:GHMP family kinase ATP-binding protein n=1 Tax=Vibrio diazotrophicus TaxID=685 RepID=UPI0005A89DC7|nr:GHMP kinase [Vibrio diazotrophicus]
MAEASCPASCGELIQGWISGGEKLVSCPIDWFSTVEVSSGLASLSNQRPMMRKALELTLKQLNIPSAESQQLKIDFQSTIPVAKGMASSTADTAATVAATYRYFQCDYTAEHLAALCAQLEPTDSTMFNALTLFDHNQGVVAAQYGSMTNLNLLVLESPIQLDTAAYHKVDHRHSLMNSSLKLDTANTDLADAIRCHNPSLLGKAATASAIESQIILPKPRFEQLLNIVEKHDLYGLNVAHSGSVVGLLFDAKKHDIEHVIFDMEHLEIRDSYPHFHQCKMVDGGVR